MMYPPTMTPLKIFIDFQTDTFMRQDSYYDYIPWHIPSYFRENNISQEIIV
jgi:hypothetical protein